MKPNPNKFNKESTRAYLRSYHIIQPYQDMYTGQIERLQNDINRLQQCVESLVVLLVDNETIENIDDYLDDISNGGFN